MRALWQRLAWWVLGSLVVVLLLWRGLLWWTDWLWFGSVGYRGVFLTTWSTRVGFLVAGLLLGFLVLLGNFLLSRRLDGRPSWAEPRPGELTGGPVLWAILPFVLSLAAVFFATSFAHLWDSFLLQRHAAPAGTADPVFGRDIAWYLTAFPFQLNLQRLLFGLCLTAWVALYCRYIELPTPGDPESFGDLNAVTPPARAHLSAFGVVVLLLAAWGLWLTRFNLLVTGRGAVLHGAGYTDVHVRIPILGVLTVLALLAAVSLLGNVRRRSLAQMGWTIGLFTVAVLLGQVVPLAVQKLAVAPNEIERERPYIERTIAATREALGLDTAITRQYAVAAGLTRGELNEERESLATVPLWAATEITEQFVGTETLRSYYNFLVADFDRYRLDGRVQQVAVVAREIQVDRLESQARNWVNRHLVYTHGYGAVMASAHDVGPAGEPVKIIRDVPPRTPAEIPLRQPRIYYGEAYPSDYIITGLRPEARTRELDYPAGDENVFTTYAGQGGVPFGGILSRLAMAARFRSLNVLISGLPGPDARIHFRRAVAERLRAIAPFLDYDSEAYPVIADGRLVWVVDAYTVSSRYPYGQPYPLAPAVALSRIQPERDTRVQAAYVRNSVKATIDAYDGTVRFHLYDPQDPLVLAYERAYPGLFTRQPLPPAVAPHIRYPMDLFALQARAYARFHMTDPAVFYNGEDLWDIAREETTTREPLADGTYRFHDTRERIAPYYVLLRLPGEREARFRLILPFTPASSSEAGTARDNMVGWMAADCDPESYGRLTVFHFPKNTTVYGPLQVEALIDQDPEISQQMSLWSQQGSQVLRGRLLVIPVGESLLYVEPLYLTADRRGALPELKRVVVMYHGRVRMAPTLAEALDQTLSGESSQGGALAVMRLERLARSANEAFAAAEAARKRGDMAAYGAALAKAGQAVSQMSGGGAR
ncbi:MAG: UPF0182 family protein [Armatimonadetes bacterium]|nr:UPF0182 family protein [Armatimonadota bacterium]